MSRAVSKMRMSWHSYQTPCKLILAQSQSDNGNSSATGARRGRCLRYPRKPPDLILKGTCRCMGPAEILQQGLTLLSRCISKSYIICFEEFSRCICEIPLIVLYSIVGTQRMKIPLIIHVYVKFPVSIG
ncbi:hypothetical protein HZ326_0811 [Fusarium oxysporum f. sp. albedinis]|nr:hypothetical protein HZ326_0811 [Fusarium oxysporum f. sp. albedinis]